jgi:hypothetical protein
MKRDLVGSHGEPAFSRTKPVELRPEWEQLLSDARIRRDGTTIGTLRILFPRFGDIWDNRDKFVSGSNKPRRIANPTYFDRFFAFEVPQEDVSDGLVAEAIGALLRGQNSEQLETLVNRFPEDASLIVPKVVAEAHRAGSEELAGAVAVWLATNYSVLPAEHDFITTRGQVKAAITELMPTVGDDRLVDVIELIAEVDEGPSLAADVLRYHRIRNLAGEDDPARIAPLETARARVAALFREAFRQFDEGPVEAIPSHTWHGVWDWLRLDPKGVHTYFSARLAEGSWSRLATAERLIGQSIPMGVPNPRPRLSNVDLEIVNELVGIAAVAEEIGVGVIENAPFITTDDRLEDTAENRRALILSALRLRVGGVPRADWPEPPSPSNDGESQTRSDSRS